MYKQLQTITNNHKTLRELVARFYGDDALRNGGEAHQTGFADANRASYQNVGQSPSRFTHTFCVRICAELKKTNDRRTMTSMSTAERAQLPPSPVWYVPQSIAIDNASPTRASTSTESTAADSACVWLAAVRGAVCLRVADGAPLAIDATDTGTNTANRNSSANRDNGGSGVPGDTRGAGAWRRRRARARQRPAACARCGGVTRAQYGRKQQLKRKQPQYHHHQPNHRQHHHQQPEQLLHQHQLQQHQQLRAATACAQLLRCLAWRRRQCACSRSAAAASCSGGAGRAPAMSETTY